MYIYNQRANLFKKKIRIKVQIKTSYNIRVALLTSNNRNT